MLPPVHPTIDTKDGDPTFESTERHPSYAMIQASRVTGSIYLYGSDLEHHGYIALRVFRGELRRGLSRDWASVTNWTPIVEVALSYAQWATFISTLNSGVGTQCTLQRGPDGDVPGIAAPAVDQREQFTEEVSAKFSKTIKRLDGLLGELADGKIPAGLRKRLADTIRMVKQDIEKDVPFVVRQFDEHVDQTTERAKTEVHAYVQQAIHSAGLEAIAGGKSVSAPDVLPPWKDGDQ